MITHVSRPQTRRVLMVDDELANPTTAGGRAVRTLADELKARGIDVVEAYSCEDGTATVTSDSALHCVLVNWTLGNNDRRSHDQGKPSAMGNFQGIGRKECPFDDKKRAAKQSGNPGPPAP